MSQRRTTIKIRAFSTPEISNPIERGWGWVEVVVVVVVGEGEGDSSAARINVLGQLGSLPKWPGPLTNVSLVW